MVRGFSIYAGSFGRKMRLQRHFIALIPNLRLMDRTLAGEVGIERKFTLDDKGNRLQTIDKNQDVEEVPYRARLDQYCVSDNKIYAQPALHSPAITA